MTRFAATTSVPIDRSQSEIQRTLTKYGATEFMFGQGVDFYFVAFQFKQRAIKIRIDAPPRTIKRDSWSKEMVANPKFDQLLKQKFRCLLLIIKAKLEAVESGIVTVEQEFMPYLVMADGRAAWEHSLPMIQAAYAEGRLPKSIFGDSTQKLLATSK